MSDFADGVTINVNGTPATITAAEQQADHAVIRYTLDTPVEAGDTVTWEYSAAAGHIVAESGGAALADVEAQEVTNNVSAELPAPLLDIETDIGITSSVTPISGTGTITQSGTKITGSGTDFLTELYQFGGDRITAAGIDGIVIAVNDVDDVDLDTSATVAVGVPFTITPQAVSRRLVSIADQSGNSHDFTASIPAPVFTNDFGDGKPALVFDWTGLNADGGNFADDLDSFTVVAVVTTIEVNADVIIGKINDFSSGAGWLCNNGAFLVQEAGGANYSQVINETYPAGASVRTYECKSRSDLNLYVNGDNSQQTFHAGTFSSHSNNLSVKIGWLDDGNSDYFGGAIRAIRIYAPALSSTDRAAVEAELAARYGITL